VLRRSDDDAHPRGRPLPAPLRRLNFLSAPGPPQLHDVSREASAASWTMGVRSS
jgi:hypothetical protein